MMEMFQILIIVAVTRACKCIEIHQSVHLKWFYLLYLDYTSIKLVLINKKKCFSPIGLKFGQSIFE